MTDQPSDPQAIRIRELLEHAIATSGLTKRHIEERLGMSRGYMTQVLHGKIDLKFTLAHRILDILKISPAAFFQLAYGAPSLQPASSLEQLLRDLESLQPAKAQLPAISPESLRSLVQGFVQEILAEPSTDSPQARSRRSPQAKR